MTKKDYELVADAIMNSIGIDELVNELCLRFKRDNPAFKPDKFRKACGYE